MYRLVARDAVDRADVDRRDRRPGVDFEAVFPHGGTIVFDVGVLIGCGDGCRAEDGREGQGGRDAGIPGRVVF